MWSFVQDQILGMRWLKELVYGAAGNLGIKSEAFTGFISFFFYDTVKIFILLSVLVFAVSFIQSFFPPERTKKILGPMNGLKARIAAALLGTLTPFCSCSSIPIFMGFASAGLPVSTCFAFLISSPMVDLGSLVLLSGIFGPGIACLYVLFGLMIAVVGSGIIGALDMEDQIAEFLRNAGAGSVQAPEPSLRERLEYALNQLASTIRRVWLYVVIGVLIGSAIHNWIPEDFVAGLLGRSNPLGVILAAICGIPMYADIFGTVPVAEALLAKGAGLGVVLSFMMAVTTLSIPSLVMLSRVVKKKLLCVFVAICTAGIIAAGFIFNALQPFFQTPL